MQFDLTPEEVEMLNEILTSYLSDLRMEIADTDSMDFREELKKREVLLKRLIADIGKS
jgi:hypothetical protein